MLPEILQASSITKPPAIEVIHFRGVNWDREDISAGVINAYDITQRKELLISAYAMKKVAEHYGLVLNGLRLSFGELASGDIVHIGGDHFVVVKEVTADSITYTEVSAGPRGAEELVTISKTEFEQVWQGIVLTTRAPPTPDTRYLTPEELQSTRGALFFLLPLIGAVFAAMGAVVSAAIGAITAVIGGIISGIGSLLAGIGSFVGNLATLNFGAAFSGLFSGIGNSIGAVFGGLGTAFTGLQGALAGSLISITAEIPFIGGALSGFLGTSFLGGTLASQIAAGGLMTLGSFGINQGLQAIGLSPKVASTIFNSGKIALGVGLLVTGNPMGLGLIGDGTAGILGTHTNLNPYVIQAISVGSQLLGGFATGGPSGLGNAFKTIAPTVAGEFAQLGFSDLANSIGLDPRLTALANVGIGAVASGVTRGIINQDATVVGYRDDGTPIEVTGNRGVFDYVKDNLLSGKTVGGLVSVGSSIGLDAIGAPPTVTNFASSFLGSLASQIDVKKAVDGIVSFGRNLVGGIAGGISLGAKIATEGFGKAISAIGNLIPAPIREAFINQGGGDLAQGIESATVINGNQAEAIVSNNRISWDGTGNLLVSDGRTLVTISDPAITQGNGLFSPSIAYAQTTDDGISIASQYGAGQLQSMTYRDIATGRDLYLLEGVFNDLGQITDGHIIDYTRDYRLEYNDGLLSRYVDFYSGTTYDISGGSVKNVSFSNFDFENYQVAVRGTAVDGRTLSPIERITTALNSVPFMSFDSFGSAGLMSLGTPIADIIAAQNAEQGQVAHSLLDFLNDGREFFSEMIRPEKYEFRTPPDYQIVDNQGLVQGTGTVDAFNFVLKGTRDPLLGTYRFETQAAILDTDGDWVRELPNTSINVSSGLDLVKADLELGFKNWVPKFEALVAMVEGQIGGSIPAGSYEIEVTFSGSIGSLGGAFSPNPTDFKLKAAVGVGGGVGVEFKRKD